MKTYIKKTILILLLFIFPVLNIFAQTAAVDTLNFSTETGLLVFKGYLNGVATNFAFDTGAGFSVLTKQQLTESKIKRSGKIDIYDSNKNNSTQVKGIIKNLVIGSHSFQNIHSVLYDMPFLSCNNLYLLGGDVINKLNWKFDLKKNLVYISKNIFEPTENMTSFPVEYKNACHYTNLNINGNSIQCLIDFGYVKNFETSRADLLFSKIEAIKKAENKIFYSKTYSMGLTSNSIGQTMASLFIDSVSIGSSTFNQFQLDIKEVTETKIGLNFFKQNCSIVIINNSESKYWIKPSNSPKSTEFGYDAYCMLSNGKLEIVEKTINQNSTADNLEVGEQIKSLNGKTAEDFIDFCTFRTWQIAQRSKTAIIFEKMNGEKVLIKKATIPH